MDVDVNYTDDIHVAEMIKILGLSLNSTKALGACREETSRSV